MNCALCGVPLRPTATPWRMLGEWSWTEATASEQAVTCCPGNDRVPCYNCHKPYGTMDDQWDIDPESECAQGADHDHDGPHVPEESTKVMLDRLGVFEQEARDA